MLRESLIVRSTGLGLLAAYSPGVQVDLEKWSGAEIRNIRLEIHAGWSDHWQWAIVDFDYRRGSQGEWSHGKMRIDTDVPRNQYAGRRLVVGHGPL